MNTEEGILSIKAVTELVDALTAMKRRAEAAESQIAAVRTSLLLLLRSYEDCSPPMLDRDDVERILRAAGFNLAHPTDPEAPSASVSQPERES
jgi:hypothetical protein